VLDLRSGEVGGARGWVAGRVGLWGVPPTWVWVVGFSPQILEHPTSIGDTGLNCGQIWCLLECGMELQLQCCLQYECCLVLVYNLLSLGKFICL